MIYGGHFDPDSKLEEIKKLEQEMSNANFWDDKEHAEKVVETLNNLKSNLNKVETIKNKIESNVELLDSLKDEDDEEIRLLIESEVDSIEIEIENVELELLLNEPYDSCDCILDIHPGAGGTESCDWASMLYRMYTRWCEKNGKKIELLDYQDGDTAGIKSVSFIVHGLNSYGYLKNEKGVHRLIRISPFDSNKRRHTSFASIDITPLYNNTEVDIEIKESDIRIDTFCASGHGGQGVNTTPSAVRITHFPSKIVVTCQNERSQQRNKEICMQVLKNKLYDIEVERREKELRSIKGENTEINFGSQIRTYTMCPYTLVKDHRTNTEEVNVDKVLDGYLDKFIYDNLKRGVK